MGAHHHHDHPHEPHDHAHHHDHHHGPPTDHSGAFVLGVAVNLAFVGVEAVYGFLSHSMALLADAGHNLGDVAGLALAGGAAILAKRKPSGRRTYGFRKTTALAALANAMLLLLVTGAIASESIRSFAVPQAVAGRTVIVVSLAGVAVNGATALLFLRDRERDLNVRSAFLHLASDAVLALGVAASGLVFLWTGLTWVDPLVSLLLAATILAGTWSLLRVSLDMVLDAVPKGIDLDQVRAYLGGLATVCEVHDLHVWSMSTTEVALTAHLVVSEPSHTPTFLRDACAELHERFGIEHATLQVEPPGGRDRCRLADEAVV